MMKRWIILCLAFSSGLLSANAGSTVVKDSLLRIYVSAPHDSTRLDVLHDIARLDQQTPVFLYYESNIFFSLFSLSASCHRATLATRSP